MELTEAAIRTKATKLKDLWTYRERQFIVWQKQRRMNNDLTEAGYESFISNDSRVFFDMALYMLSQSKIQHKLPILRQAQAEKLNLSKCERALRSSWHKQDRALVARGESTWMRKFCDFLLQTGWYAIQVLATEEPPYFRADVWNPANVYQEYGDDGLVSVVHMYTISNDAARLKAAKMGVKLMRFGRSNSTVINYWGYDDLGQPVNAVTIQDQFVKPPTVEPRFAVMTGPCNGFADRGAIEAEADTGAWRARMGESVLEKNRTVVDKLNRWLTFAMQQAREAADFAIEERTDGDGQVTPENWRRKGVYSYGAEDPGIRIIAPPDLAPATIPILQMLNNMVTKGSLPESFYGTTSVELSGFAIQQMMNTALQVLTPFKETRDFVVGEIDQQWLEGYRDHGGAMDITTVEDQGIFMEVFEPKDVPKRLFVNVSSNLALPSDLAQRVDLARRLRPEGNLADETFVMDNVLEVEDPQMMQQRKVDDLIYENPSSQLALLAISVTQQIKNMTDVGGPNSKEQIEVLSRLLNGLLTQLGAAPPGAAPGARPGLDPATLPPEQGTGGALNVQQAIRKARG